MIIKIENETREETLLGMFAYFKTYLPRCPYSRDPTFVHSLSLLEKDNECKTKTIVKIIRVGCLTNFH